MNRKKKSMRKRILAWALAAGMVVSGYSGNGFVMTSFAAESAAVETGKFGNKSEFTYTIEKQRFWVMGGAISIDITDGLFDKEDPLLKEKILDLKKQGKNYYRIRGINWFPEEMPSEEEQERGMESLRKNGMETDYIITHAAPTMVSNYFSAWRFKADELTDYFEKIRKEVQFKRWFCGHYHVDEEMVVEGKNFQILYNKIERIY